jgi:hypothetical protein
MTKLPKAHMAAMFAVLLSCAGPAEEGEVEVRVWGEAFLEEGIPAAVMADGWAIDFTRFEVELRDVSVADATLDDPEEPFDIAQPSDGRGQLVGRVQVAAGVYYHPSHPAFTLVRVQIEGVAEKDGVQKSFAWTFNTPVDYTNCETTIDVPSDGVGEFQITVHGDHLFFDSLVSPESSLRFDPIAAADTDDDSEVTMAELAATDIGAYDPGNLDIDDLWSFLSEHARTIGHVDGEGYCAS